MSPGRICPVPINGRRKFGVVAVVIRLGGVDGEHVRYPVMPGVDDPPAKNPKLPCGRNATSLAGDDNGIDCRWSCFE